MAKKRKKQSKLPKGFIRDEVPSPRVDGTDKVIRRMTGHPIEVLYKRRVITEPQKAAADKFELAHVVCNGQDGQSIDYAKERVDTFGVGEALQEYQLKAMDVIKEASNTLDKESIIRVTKIVGEGLTVEEYCRAIHKKAYRNFIQDQREELKNDLSHLAVAWGYESKKVA